MTAAKIIGHRAYRGYYPENTILAFDKAKEANVDVIETDLQMSKDGVVVINHDQDTQRCWDKNYVISETNWDMLQSLNCKDTRFQDQKMPSLKQVLRWIVDNPSMKLMLDIKFTNDQEIMLKSVAEMLSTKEDLLFWRERVIWGLWTVDWFRYGMETGVIKDFQVACISLSLEVARSFVEYSRELNSPHFRLSGVSMHFVSTWSKTFQKKWLHYFQQNNIEIYVWTINHATDFKYCNALPISGFVTDFPIEARGAIEQYERNKTVFKRPFFISKEGLRFYGFLVIYRLTIEFLFSPWAQYKVFGNFSFSLLFIKFMRIIHFL
ncbi:LAQU0S08e03950g1_1 [Lachancea quebecensis]|uniref:LAQU0S08e03950g1_1 n=1 Tax=Lachancea quebecensis TaxID=1654605 RepID=A0A0P1KTP4_9SACH|nr:LAQU0S08e03950g1_1 [Lachancea quebecensis]